MQSADPLLIETNVYTCFEVENTIRNSKRFKSPDTVDSVRIIQEKVETLRSGIYKDVNSNWNSEEPTVLTPTIASYFSLPVVNCSISHAENDLK
jgi:hypothetical protein